MNKLLIKLFVKNYEDVSNPKVRESYGKFAGVIGIFSNGLLCAMKLVIGVFSGSIAIIADGINNLADTSSSIITLIGFKMAARPEDADHPYGHARIEYITGLFISVLIIILGLQLLRTSFTKVLNPDPLSFSYLTLALLIIAIIIKVWQAAFNISLGKKIKSVALLATGTDSRNDVIATTGVLLSVLVGKFFDIKLDGIMGCLVALFIIWSGIQLIRETSSPLLGEAPDKDLVAAIATHVRSTPGVLGIHDLVVHNYGPGKIFASIHIEVDADENIMVSHDIVDNIERSIKTKLNIEFTAHMDPVKVNDPLVTKLNEVIRYALAPLEGVESIHDLRIVPGTTHTNIIFDAVLHTGCTNSEAQIIDTVENEVRKIDPSYYVVITFDKIYTAL
ncbi:MAG: cation diffusion facilitator family transporter [Anaerovoracaceae bacterium]